MSDIKLIALCASHINTFARLKCFEYMVESWNAQQTPVLLFISMSYEQSLKNVVHHIVNTYMERYEYLIVKMFDQHFSQFEHYKYLSFLSRKFVTDDCWVMFTDDDDIWHPQRSEYYDEAAYRFESDQNLVRCSYYACQTKNKSLDKLFTYESVKNSDILYDKGNPEYFQYSLRLSKLIQFVSECSTDLLKNKYCDVLFVKFMTTKTVVYEWVVLKENWMYLVRWNLKIGHVCSKIHLPNNFKSIISNFSENLIDNKVIKNIFHIVQQECMRNVSTPKINNIIESYANVHGEQCTKYKKFIMYLLKQKYFQALINSPVYQS